MGIREHRLLIFLLLFFTAAAQAGAQSSEGGSSYLDNTYTTKYDAKTQWAIVAFLVLSFLVVAFCFHLHQYVTLYLYPQLAFALSFLSANRNPDFSLGLDRKVIESFPVLLYSEVKDLKIGKGTLECAICISMFDDDDTLRLLPKCDHVFHPECIDVWLANHVTCPVCRRNLLPDQPDGAEASESTHSTTFEIIEFHNQVSVNVDESNQGREEQVIDIENISKESPMMVKTFTRSKSTSHLLISAAENCERYALRLPEEVQKQITTMTISSTVALPPGEDSSGRGYRSEGSRRGRSNEERLFGRAEWKASFDCFEGKTRPPI